MRGPGACPDCLRRSRLLAHLAPYIEKVASGELGSRSPELLRLSNEDLVEATAPKVAAQMLAQIEAVPEQRLRAELVAAQCWACCRHDAGYPSGLHDAADAPWALIGRGDPALLERLEPDGAVTVVGARRASSYGRGIARELGRELAAADLLVVSGLALASTPAPTGARSRAARPLPCSAAAPTLPIPPLTARFGERFASVAWCFPSCHRGPVPGGGPSRRATGSWRRWPG